MINKAAYEQRRLARQMLAEGRSWTEIAETLQSAFSLLCRFAAMRQAHGWSQRCAVDEWNRRWSDDGIGLKTIGRWETWQTDWGRTYPSTARRGPTLAHLDHLAELYECSASYLLAGWADYTPRGAPRVQLGATGDRYPEGVNRRDFGKSMAGAGLLVLAPTPVFDEPVHVAPTDVEHHWERAWQLRLSDREHGGDAAYRGVLAQLAELKGLLGHGRYDEATGIGLQRVAGHLHFLGGLSAGDEGERLLSRWHLNEALTSGRLSDDEKLSVLVLTEMAYQELLHGEGASAIEKTQAALRGARGFATPIMRSRLAAREAVGRAQLGEVAKSERLLAQSEQWLDNERALDDGSWLGRWTWDQGGWQNAVAMTHIALDAGRAAEEASRAAVDRCHPMFPRTKAEFSARLAGVLVANGSLDEASRVACDTVQLLEGIGSRRTRAGLRALRPALAGFPEAQEALRTV